jgi:hypothetical protein
MKNVKLSVPNFTFYIFHFYEVAGVGDTSLNPFP